MQHLSNSDDSVTPSSGSTRARHRPLTPEAEKISDACLVQAHLAGDEAAFTTLYRRHYVNVKSACRRRLRDEGAAEDAAQETFLRVFRALPRLRDPGGVGAYITVAARTVCIDVIRRRSASHEAAAPSDPEGFEHSGPLAPGPTLEQRVEDRYVTHQILSAARPTDALLLRAHHREGVPLEELARILGSTPGSIAVRLHRARQRALQFAKANSLHGVLWPILLRLRARARLWGGQSALAAAAAPVLLALALMGGAAAGPLLPQAGEGGVFDPAEGERRPAVHLERVRPTPGTKQGGTSSPNVSRRSSRTTSTSSAPLAEDAVVDDSLVRLPVTDTRIEKKRPEGDPDHRIGTSVPVDPVRDDPVEVGYEAHDEPETRPLREAACPATNLGRPITYCDSGT